MKIWFAPKTMSCGRTVCKMLFETSRGNKYAVERSIDTRFINDSHVLLGGAAIDGIDYDREIYRSFTDIYEYEKYIKFGKRVWDFLTDLLVFGIAKHRWSGIDDDFDILEIETYLRRNSEVFERNLKKATEMSKNNAPVPDDTYIRMLQDAFRAFEKLAFTAGSFVRMKSDRHTLKAGGWYPIHRVWDNIGIKGRSGESCILTILDGRGNKVNVPSDMVEVE